MTGALGSVGQVGSAAGAVAPEVDGVSSKRLIFWLFVALAAATAVALLTFVHAMGDCDGDGVPDAQDRSIQCDGMSYDGTHVVTVVYDSLAGDLAAPVIVWFLLAGIGSTGAWRRFWFWGAAPAGLITMASVLAAVLASGGSAGL